MDKRIIYLIAFILITAVLGYYWKKNKEEDFSIEGFQNVSIKEHYSDIYDNFYSNIYDQLFNSNLKNEFEIYSLKKYAFEKYPDQNQRRLQITII